tara:strand:+ start:2182 stop:3528 length:1347 start_codon:yes stop_codon:yes gene_type:complete
MPDIDPNIIIDISGNTAEMATDYNTSGTGLTGAHVAISKVGWGDSTITERVTETTPLPVKIHGATAELGITGSVDIGNTPGTPIVNYNWDRPDQPLIYLAIAGATSGPNTERVGTSGPVWGVPGATAIAVTGDVRIIQTTYINVQGFTSGSTADWDSGSSAGFGVPVNVTGGRHLRASTDTVTVEGTVNATGGRQLSAGTDSIAIYGFDGDKYVQTIAHGGDGTTLGTSGDSLKVAITNTDANVTFNVSATTGVTNDVINTDDSNAPHGALKVQGVSGGVPVIVKGENSGAVEVTATTALNTSVSGTVTIDDTNIVDALEKDTKPLVKILNSIKKQVTPVSNIRTDLTSGNVKVKVTENVRPTRVYSGKVSTTVSAQQLDSNTRLLSGVHVKVQSESSTNITVGGKELVGNPINGYLLEPGESIFIECDNLNKVYVTGNGVNAFYLGS